MESLKQRTGIFIKNATLVHNHKYDYSKVQYSNTDAKIIIICKLHGEFKQTPYKHYNMKQGCPSCRADRISQNKRMSLKDFIEKSKNIHNGKYDYSYVEYKNAHVKVKILCSNHGPFLITPNNHIYGVRGKGGKAGCPACSNNVSYAGQEWLDSLKNSNIEREVSKYIGSTRFKFDGYDKSTNTVYEYFGSYWHGNPDKYDSEKINKRTKTKFGDLYKATINKINLIKNAGYNLIFIWGD